MTKITAKLSMFSFSRSLCYSSSISPSYYVLYLFFASLVRLEYTNQMLISMVRVAAHALPTLQNWMVNIYFSSTLDKAFDFALSQSIRAEKW